MLKFKAIKSRLFQLSAIAIASILLDPYLQPSWAQSSTAQSSLAQSSLAQSTDPAPNESPPDTPTESSTEASPDLITICRYDPESGFPNALGPRTYLSLTERENNTVVTLERFPIILNNSNSPDQRADISEERSLTLYDTNISAARQLLRDQPLYYATLLEIDEGNSQEGFAAVDQTLGCGQIAAETPTDEGTTEEAAVEEIEAEAETADPTETTTEESEPEETTTISENNSLSGLPNGNYRFVSADFPNRVVTDEELLEAGGAFFLFRKFGDNITGVFGYIDHEGGSCISGTVDGNTVVGTAYGYSENVREGGFLTLGEEAGDLAYEGSVLNLESFSRINAGSRLPVESCP